PTVLVDEGGHLRRREQRRILSDAAQVRTDAHPAVSHRAGPRREGRSHRQGRRRRDDPVAVGLEDAAAHPRSEAEVIGVHDEQATRNVPQRSWLRGPTARISGSNWRISRTIVAITDPDES